MATKTKSVNKEVVKPVTISKMDIAVQIMEEDFPKFCKGELERKEIIKRFMDEAKLTKAGSSTYFFNIKKKMLENELN